MPSVPTKIVFLIDEESLMRQEGITLEQLKLTIVRILLFYYSCQPNILWGYRFFSTKTRYGSSSIRQFYTLSNDTFNTIQQEYEKRNTERKSTAVLGTPFMRIKQVLKEAIGDFQWENMDCTTNSNNSNSKHYVYVLTDCPASLNDINTFFVSPNQEEVTNLMPCTAYFQQTKEDLATTLLDSYTRRQISINLIDTTYTVPAISPEALLVDRMIYQGFQSCFDQFNGKYIQFHSLIRNYSIYGHSFVSEFASLLPNALVKRDKKPVPPAWKGPFKTKLGKRIGDFVLFPSQRDEFYKANTLFFISEIRTYGIVHASQFSLSWLLEENGVEPNHDYRFTFEYGDSGKLFHTLLDELYATQSILIAELIPMAGYEEMSKKVCIEPFSRSCASFRLLNIQNLPNTIQLGPVRLDQDYPIGTFTFGTDLTTKLPSLPNQDSATAAVHTQLNMEPPSFIKKMNIEKNTNLIKEKLNVNNSQVEEYVEKIIQLPANVNMMGKALKKLYLELLYTQNDTVENNLIIIDQWIKHLLKNNYTKQEIISTLFDYTMTLEDLDVKYKNGFSQSFKRDSNTLEQTYLAEWWDNVKNRTRLVNDLPANTIKRDPFELAENFFKKTVLPYALHDITDFLTEIDSEEGSSAVARRDPADLNDYIFMQLLEKCFTDLPSLTNKFKDNVGMDDMSSFTSSPSRIEEADDDFLEDESQIVSMTLSPPPLPPSQQLIKESYETKRHLLRRAQSDRSLPKGAHSDNLHLSKPDHRKSTPSSLAALSKYSKPLLPIPMQRASSNSKLDGLHKRMIHVPSSTTKAAEIKRGEAAQEAIAKVNRSTVNGRPTMKRTGSFTKSAQSPKRVKRQPSMLSTDTNSVVLRRENIPDPQTTPRTSLNRHLGTNLFAEYSETCLSPSFRTTDDESRQSQEYIQSEYPQGSTTPQGTATRFKKMMNITPHRDDDDDDEEEEFSVPRDEFGSIQLPYTPRTAARRAKDRMDRSQISVGRNLTSKFQNIFDQEKQERPYKRSNYMFDGDDENIDPFSDNDSSSSRALLDRIGSFNENRKMGGGFSFVEDSDSESDNESNVTTM
ncbi:hypothetical protein INT48_006247 [Thamnidium elegans]|uniref:Treslin N-terminal domain-containing protein n=1 Tax=Thamnidium elegans TaxID=101142 RepID=A0A8H7SI82_9FUNG|nr:hypothetical protein INT48_006247 [Thamnidium elegans]